MDSLDGLLDELTVVSFQSLWNSSEKHKQTLPYAYLAYWLGHPDSGSDFDQIIGMKKYLFRIPFLNQVLVKKTLPLFFQQGYDMLLAYLPEQFSDASIVAHAAFQYHRQQNALHVFHMYVHPHYRGKGLAIFLGEQILGYAKEQAIKKIRYGKGGHPAMEKIIHHLEKNYTLVSFPGNWVVIP